MSFLKATLIALFSLPSLASPTGISLNPWQEMAKQIHFPQEFFSLKVDRQKWRKIEHPESEAVIASFQSIPHPDLFFSVQVDPLDRFPSESPSLKKYLQFYGQKLPRSGLVLQSDLAKSTHNYYANLEMELPSQSKWILQSLIWHPHKKVVILTCKSSQKNKALMPSLCSSMVQGLQWYN